MSESLAARHFLRSIGAIGRKYMTKAIPTGTSIGVNNLRGMKHQPFLLWRHWHAGDNLPEANADQVDWSASELSDQDAANVRSWIVLDERFQMDTIATDAATAR